MANTDDSWEKFGKADPYYGVLSHERFRQSNMTADARADFFKSGEAYVEFLFKTIRGHLEPDFSPRHALDFGCGVGRIAIPLAGRVAQVIAADVSPSMLSEAKRNCIEQGVDNLLLVNSNDILDGVPPALDFVHSFIVFQHIPTHRGMNILKKMLTLLTENGVGALHFTFARRASRVRILLQRACESIPLANNVANLLRGRPFSAPLMEMNYYDLNAILQLLYDDDCHDIHVRFSDHDGIVGALLLFKRRSIPHL